MNTAQNGKGSRPRPIDRQKWEESPLWNNMKSKSKNERIYNENKHLIEDSNIEIVEDKPKMPTAKEWLKVWGDSDHNKRMTGRIEEKNNLTTEQGE